MFIARRTCTHLFPAARPGWLSVLPAHAGVVAASAHNSLNPVSVHTCQCRATGPKQMSIWPTCIETVTSSCYPSVRACDLATNNTVVSIMHYTMPPACWVDGTAAGSVPATLLMSWVANGFRTSVYKQSLGQGGYPPPTPFTVYDAESTCQARGGHLLSLLSMDEASPTSS